ncbi:TonB-dependent siderophore receptor, partial [Escherichia coli]
GDNLRTQIAAYYSLSNKSVERNKDLTISVKDDRRRIYGVEGAVDYLIPDTDWSTGVNFNVLKTESKVNGQWQKYDVKESSP